MAHGFVTLIHRGPLMGGCDSGENRQMVDPNYARNNLDADAMHVSHDAVNGEPRYLGFCCPDHDGGFLTLLTTDASEQMFLSREQLEWLLREGIPAWLAEMDGS